MKMTGGPAEVDMKVSAKNYIKDGKQYVDISGAQDMLAMMGYTGEYKLPSKMYQDITSVLEVTTVNIPDYTFSDLFEMIPEGEWGNYVKISKSSTDTGFKIKVSAEKETLNELISQENSAEVSANFTDDAELYIIYENSQFAGLYLNAQANIVIDAENSVPELYQMTGKSKIVVKASYNVQIVGWNGEIEYPTDLDTNYVNMATLEM